MSDRRKRPIGSDIRGESNDMVSFRSDDATDGPRSDGPGSRPTTKHTAQRGRPRCADGGVAWNDLTGFQRDLLKAIRRCDRDGQVPTGQTIKDRLETEYGESINNGRLYQNLGHLVESGLLEKGFVDGRTNTYSLDATARVLLDETAHNLADICGIETVARTG